MPGPVLVGEEELLPGRKWMVYRTEDGKTVKVPKEIMQLPEYTPGPNPFASGPAAVRDIGTNVAWHQKRGALAADRAAQPLRDEDAKVAEGDFLLRKAMAEHDSERRQADPNTPLADRLALSRLINEREMARAGGDPYARDPNAGPWVNDPSGTVKRVIRTPSSRVDFERSVPETMVRDQNARNARKAPVDDTDALINELLARARR